MPELNDSTRAFHQIVEHGSLQELDTVLKSCPAINAHGHCGRNALMVAIEARDLVKMAILVQNGADPELTDDFNHTALGYAVWMDFEDGVRYLLSLGVDRGYKPKNPLKKIDYDIPFSEVTMPDELKNVMSESEWRESLEESRKSLAEAGQNPTARPLIADVQSIGILKLFIDAGDDLNLAPRDVKRTLVGLETGGELRSTESDYRTHRYPQFGASNPERMDFPFWREMIRTGVNAYAAREQFNDISYSNTEPVWCYDRFGSSITILPDGRYVQIGGEHEDHYMPDFYIYNDVVVHDGKGSFEIYGYPRDSFPSTDFHSATLCDKCIYVIGCLGYPQQRRVGHTPVYRLALDSWEIDVVQTTGDAPGWIYEHRAIYEPARNVIVVTGGKTVASGEDGSQDLVANQERFEFDMTRFEWRKVK